MISTAMFAAIAMLPNSRTYDELARTTASELVCMTKFSKGSISYESVMSKDKAYLYPVLIITGDTQSDIGVGERFVVGFSDQTATTGLLVAKTKTKASIALSPAALGSMWNNDYTYLQLNSLSGNEPGRAFASIDFAETGDAWRQSLTQFRDCMEEQDELAAAD